MAEPSNYPEWASAPTPGDIVEPNSTKKQSGWRKVSGAPEKPPYQQFNWYMNNVYLWIKHFKEEAVTFTGLKSFTSGIKTSSIAETVTDSGFSVVGSMNTTQRAATPATPAAGTTKVYSKTDGKMYLLNSDGIETPVGSGSTVARVNKVSHGFIVGNPLDKVGADWVKADAEIGGNNEARCSVSRVIDADNFEYVTNGIVNGLVAACFTEGVLPAQDAECFLSTTPGKLTVTAPSVVGQINKPIFFVTANNTTTVDGIFENMRGQTVGGTNLYTPISLANNATTTFHTIQGDAGTGGWISGTIKIDGTTDYAIPFFCFFSRQPDGTTYHVSPFYGSSIPTGLSITNSGSSIRVVMPDVGSPGTCSVTYAVQAAANGTTLPVSVSASSVLGSTSGVAPAAGVIGEQIVSSVSLSNFAATTVWGDYASISLTAGVWDIVAVVQGNKNGAQATISEWKFGIGTASGNSFSDFSLCDNGLNLAVSADTYDSTGTTPPVRKTLSSTTTIYLKAQATYSSGQPRLRGKLVATRIG
jgi:hypothetical protein